MSIFSADIGLLEDPVGLFNGRIDRIGFSELQVVAASSHKRAAPRLSPFGSLDHDRTPVSEDVWSN
jgi:hypothetical protein